MNLYEQTKHLWGGETALSSRWIRCLTDALPKVKAARAMFHEWEPLRVYLSVTNALKPSIEFSLRFRGQEVATLSVPEAGPLLKIGTKHQERNRRYFGVSTSPGTSEWSSTSAANFRRAFRSPASQKAGRVHSPEHEIESRILIDMKGGPNRFAGTLAHIQPVGLGGFPFQCPVPISASGGKPRAKRGNLDILARRRSGARTLLSLWELKAPGKLAGALEQVYIYAVVLALMLRGHEGDNWYRLFGFKGPVPQKLTLEALVVLTPDQQAGAERAMKRLLGAGNPLRLEAENVNIELSAAFYDPATLAIEMKGLT